MSNEIDKMRQEYKQRLAEEIKRANDMIERMTARLAEADDADVRTIAQGLAWMK